MCITRNVLYSCCSTCYCCFDKGLSCVCVTRVRADYPKNWQVGVNKFTFLFLGHTRSFLSNKLCSGGGNNWLIINNKMNYADKKNLHESWCWEQTVAWSELNTWTGPDDNQQQDQIGVKSYLGNCGFLLSFFFSFLSFCMNLGHNDKKLGEQ